MQYWGLRAGCLYSPSTSSFRLIPAMKTMDCENVTVVLRCYFGRRHLQSLNLCYHQNCHVMCNQQMLFKVPGFSCYTLYCSGLNLYTYLTWSRCRLSPFSTLPLQRTVESPGCYQSFCSFLLHCSFKSFSSYTSLWPGYLSFWTLVSMGEKLWGYQTTKLKLLWQLQVKSTFYFLAFANKELLTLLSPRIGNERVSVLFVVVQLNFHHTTLVIQR